MALYGYELVLGMGEGMGEVWGEGHRFLFLCVGSGIDEWVWRRDG